jgi:hypothetical protein
MAIGVIDEVISPQGTRRRLAEAFAAAPAGRGHHGNIPLLASPRGPLPRASTGRTRTGDPHDTGLFRPPGGHVAGRGDRDGESTAERSSGGRLAYPDQ